MEAATGINIRTLETPNGCEDWPLEEQGLTVLKGDPKGRIVYLRRAVTARKGILRAGFAVSQPYTGVFTPLGDEAVFLIEGHGVFEIEGGEATEVRDGDLVILPGGRTVMWTANSPCKELFIMAG